MKFSKSVGEFKGIFNMYGAYKKLYRTTSTQAQYFERTLKMCVLLDEPEWPKDGNHLEEQKSEVVKSKKALQRELSAIKNFMKPFEGPSKNQLDTLSSGPWSLQILRRIF